MPEAILPNTKVTFMKSSQLNVGKTHTHNAKHLKYRLTVNGMPLNRFIHVALIQNENDVRNTRIISIQFYCTNYGTTILPVAVVLGVQNPKYRVREH